MYIVKIHIYFQALYNGQDDTSQCVHYLEVPLLMNYVIWPSLGPAMRVLIFSGRKGCTVQCIVKVKRVSLIEEMLPPPVEGWTFRQRGMRQWPRETPDQHSLPSSAPAHVHTYSTKAQNIAHSVVGMGIWEWEISSVGMKLT